MAHSLRVHTVCLGGKNWMESDAAGHIAVTLSKQRAMHADTQFRFFFLFSLGFPAKGMLLPTLRVGLSASVYLVEKLPHRHTPRGLIL